MFLFPKGKSSVLDKVNGQEQIVEAAQVKRGLHAKDLYESEKSRDVAADLDQELAFIKGELAAAQLELTTGKEDKLHWWRLLK